MQTDPASNPTNRSANGLSTPAQFRSKLGTYLSGVIIGFMLLGMIYLMKYYATQGQQATGAPQVVPTEMEVQP